MSGSEKSGGCLCGAVRYRVRGPLRSVIACHCGQCRRWSGHTVAATSTDQEQLQIDGDTGLRWYESSPGIRRGFCGRCGSSLFWDDSRIRQVSIMAGTLDPPTGLETTSHIFLADKGDYYQITDGLPQHPKDLASPSHSNQD